MAADIETIFNEIAAFWGERLLSEMELFPIAAEEVPRLLELTDAYFSPIFLPVFDHSSSNSYALHVVPGRDWREMAWYTLFHDGRAGKLASNARCLPSVILAGEHGVDDRLWDELVAMVHRIPGGILPDREVCARWRESQAEVPLTDADDVPSALVARLKECASLAEAQSFIEQRHREQPSPWTTYLVAAKRILAGEAGSVVSANEALECELPEGFRAHPQWIGGERSSVINYLKWFSHVVAASGDQRPGLAAFVQSSEASDAELTATLLSLSADALEHGRERAALGLIRNAAYVAADHGKITAPFCERVAEISDRVDPGGLAGQVARAKATALAGG